MHTDAVSWSSIARPFYLVFLRGRDESSCWCGSGQSPATPCPLLPCLTGFGVGGLLENRRTDFVASPCACCDCCVLFGVWVLPDKHRNLDHGFVVGSTNANRCRVSIAGNILPTDPFSLTLHFAQMGLVATRQVSLPRWRATHNSPTIAANDLERVAALPGNPVLLPVSKAPRHCCVR